MIRDIILIVLNIVNPVAIYFLYSTFLGEEKYNKKIVFISYFLFNLVTTFILLTTSSSIFNAISFIISIMLLTLLYKGNIIYKLFISFSIYAILAMIEVSMTFFIRGNDTMLQNLEFDINFFYVLVKMIFLAGSIVIYLNFNRNRNQNVPNFIIILLSLIPVLSLIIIIFETLRYPVAERYFVISSVVLLIINISIFTIFNVLDRLYNDKLNLQSINKNYELLNLQKENIEYSTEKLAALEHDLKNKLVPLYYMADSKDNIGEYLSDIIGEFKKEFLISNTGIIEVDAIINSKYEICKKRDIKFKVDINISNKVNINYRDLGVILGNLIDNSIEATSKTSDKWIKLVLQNEMNLVLIMVDNSFDGEVIKEKGSFISRKNKKYSGIGLKKC